MKVAKPTRVFDFVLASTLCGLTLLPSSLFAAQTAPPRAHQVALAEKRVIEVMQLVDQDPDPETAEKAYPDSVVVKQSLYDAHGVRKEQMSCTVVARGPRFFPADVIYVTLDIDNAGTRTTFTGLYNPGDQPSRLWTQYGPHASALVMAPRKLLPTKIFGFVTRQQREAEAAVSQNLYNNCGAIVADANTLIASHASYSNVKGQFPTTRYELSGTLSVRSGKLIVQKTDAEYGNVLHRLGLY